MSQPSTRRAILEEAAAIVVGEREHAYGGPEDSFRDIAGLWNAYLQAKSRRLCKQGGGPGVPPLEPYDVAVMQMMVKTARLVGSSGAHRDSWVDMAGYAACGAECGLPDAQPSTESAGPPDPPLASPRARKGEPLFPTTQVATQDPAKALYVITDTRYPGERANFLGRSPEDAVRSYLVHVLDLPTHPVLVDNGAWKCGGREGAVTLTSPTEHPLGRPRMPPGPPNTHAARPPK